MMGDDLRVALMEQISTVLWSNKHALMKAFQFYDTRKECEITKSEFTRVLRVLNTSLNNKSPPLSADQIELLVDHCTFREGMIQYKQFLDSLVVTDMHTGEVF